MHLLALTTSACLLVKMSEAAVAVGVGRLNPGGTILLDICIRYCWTSYHHIVSRELQTCSDLRK